ncbi:MAG: DUF1273 domain-containing protein [Oscillospiraceae bacterium]|nr:DUF1273 domain-containing protein [Oscillospiraceae bacterium]
MMNKFQSCCFTGHRYIESERQDRLRRMLDSQIKRYITEEGVSYFYAGGAVGFDTICAQSVLGYKKQYPHIKLGLMLPCPEQSEGWSKQDADIYEYIKKKSDFIKFACKSYSPGCMFERNRMLVDACDYCLAYLESERKSGTLYTVKYAAQKGLKITNLADDFTFGQLVL